MIVHSFCGKAGQYLQDGSIEIELPGLNQSHSCDCRERLRQRTGSDECLLVRSDTILFVCGSESLRVNEVAVKSNSNRHCRYLLLLQFVQNDVINLSSEVGRLILLGGSNPNQQGERQEMSGDVL